MCRSQSLRYTLHTLFNALHTLLNASAWITFCALILSTIYFSILRNHTHIPPLKHMLIDCISHCVVHVYPCKVFTIWLYPHGQMHAWTIPSIVFIYQSHYRFPKPRVEHFSTCAPVFKASSVHTPPPYGRSAQYPIQGLETLLFWHLPFESIQESIYLT